MKTKRSHEGYLQIDHRDSPGTLMVPGGTNGEWPTVTCAHCQFTYAVNPLRERARGWCWNCDEYICDKPECRECNGSMRKVFDTLQEAQARGLRVTPGGIILP